MVSLTAKLRATLVSDASQAIPAGAIVNDMAASVESGDGPMVTGASAEYTVNPGSPIVDIEKTLRNSSGEYTGDSVVVATGDVLDYAIVLENRGTSTVIPALEDRAPAQLTAVASANDGYDYRAPGSMTWVPLTDAFPGVVPVYTPPTAPGDVATWTFPGVTLAPGEAGAAGAAIRVRTAYQVNAGTIGNVDNVAVATGVGAAGCVTSDWNAGVCSDTHRVQVSTRGGFIIEKTSQGLPGENKRQAADGSVGACGITTGFTRYPCVATVGTGAEYQYAIQVTNHGVAGANALTIADRLSSGNGVLDTAITNTTAAGARGAEWKGSIASFPVVQRVSPTGAVSEIATATFLYTTSTDVCAADVTVNPDTCASGEWIPFTSATPVSEYENATGISVVLDLAGAPLAPGESARVQWSMTAPTEMTWGQDSTNYATAAASDGDLVEWNTAAYLASVIGAGDAALQAGESSKAGIRLAVGELRIEKAIDNLTIAPDSAFGPFELAFRCVDPADASSVTAEGTVFAIVAADGTIGYAPTAAGPTDANANRFVVSAGSICTVTEPGDGGADATAFSQNAVVIGSTPQVVTATNTFEAASLTVTKAVVGDAPTDVTEFPITVVCSVNGVELTLDPEDAAFTLAHDGEHVINGLPNGSDCIITETDNGGAIETTINGETVAVGVGAAVDVTGSTNVPIVNNFGATALTIVKNVENELNGAIPVGPFEITVTCQVPGENEPRIDVIEFSALGGTETLVGYPAGTDCTTVETDTAFAHETVIDDSEEPAIDGAVTLDINESESVTVTNRYEAGTLVVTKATHGATDEIDWDFELACTWDGGEHSEALTATLDDAAVFTGIPVGSDCTVTEVGSSASETAWASGDMVLSTTSELSFTVDEATFGTEALFEVVAQNYYLADLTITKLVDGKPVADGAAYEVTLTPNDPALPVHTIEIAAGQTVVIESLLAGTQYTVVETKTGGADSVAYEGLLAGSITLVQDADNAVTVTNTFVEKKLGVTGDGINGMGWALGLLGAGGLALLVGYLWRRRRTDDSDQRAITS